MEKKLMYSNTKGNKTPQHLWHRLLLVLITMLTGITGAWADGATISYNWNGLSTITTNGAGNITSEFLTTNFDSGNSSKYANYVKVIGEVNQSDITALAGEYSIDSNNNGGACIDFSEATGDVTFTAKSAYKGIKLPTGTDLSTYSGPQTYAFYQDGDNVYLRIIDATNGLEDVKKLSVSYSWANAPVNYKTVYLSGNYGDFDAAKAFLKNNAGATEVIKVVAPSNDPYEVNGCNVSINMNKAGEKSFSTVLSEAKAAVVAGGQTNICTLTVVGELGNNDLAILGDAVMTGASRIDLSGATLASGASIDNLQLPSSLTSLVLPEDQTVSTALSGRMTAITGLMYAYSPSSDCTATGPNQADESKPDTYKYDDTKNTIADYVWVNKAGGLAEALENEEQLRNSFYIKVGSWVALTATDINFGALENKPTNYLFLDLSESIMTPTVADSYTVDDNIPYRIILPNNWSNADLAHFQNNENKGNLAAVYSYEDTKLNILVINDDSYWGTALQNPRIVRAGTNAIDILPGAYINNHPFGTSKTNGKGIITAINNANPSIKSVYISIANTGDNYNSNAYTFSNPNITYLNFDGLMSAFGTGPNVNVSGCTKLQTLDVKNADIYSLDAQNISSLTSVNLTGTKITDAADLSGSGVTTAGFQTNGSTEFKGTLNLAKTALTSFSTPAKVTGDINLNKTPLTSLDLTSTQFQNKTSKIHVHAEDDESNNNPISGLNKGSYKTINVPYGFDKKRIHPNDNNVLDDNILEEEPTVVTNEYTKTATDMTFHDKEEAGDKPDHYRYWYQGSSTDNDGIITLGTSTTRLATLITGHPDLKSDTHAKIRIVGPLTSADVDSLARLNCTALDLSNATSGVDGKTIGELLKDKFKTTGAVHSNTRFIALPDTCSRDSILNATALAGLANSVYCVIAVNDVSNGKDLTSYSFKSGSLQPAVTIFQNSSAQSWTTIKDGYSNTSAKYVSTVSDFKKLKIGGLINSYDLAGPAQGLKLNDDGHLVFKEAADENNYAQKRTMNGGNTIYGPFSACFLITEIDLRDAYLEEYGDNTGLDEQYKRYWGEDITLSALGVISTATYKVVIPQDKRVHELPADFMNCSTNIRAICIPSNIQAIRTRAFWTIDYVWTTADAFASGNNTADPEGENTRLDNGAKLRDGTQVNALLYNTTTQKYEENPAFDSYYTADYSGVNGGGSYTFGSTLKMIESGAFANTQPNVRDVYVLNTIAPECHVDAFNTVMYTGNGGYNPTEVTNEGIITREAYFNGRWITMLHYPRQTTDPNIQRYTDPTREYSIATGERDGKGAIIYFPNQSEFIRAYQQGTFGYTWRAWNPAREYGSVNNGNMTNTTEGWTAKGQTGANALFDAYASGTDHQYRSFYDVSSYTGVTAPTTTIVPYYNVNWSGSAYSTVTPQANLYLRSEKEANNDADNSGEKTPKDYRGWHQFVLTAYAANTVLEEEPYRSYITDNEWWTICPEFDITEYEAALLFGKVQGVTTPGQTEYPKVHKLQYVRRTYENGVIHLCFTKDLATYRENRNNTKVTYTRDGESNITGVTAFADQHGSVNNTTGVIEVLVNTPASDDVVMSAGVPYLIKPNLPVNAKRQYIIFKSVQDAQNYSSTHTAATDPVAVGSPTLYYKIKHSQDLSGTDQRAIIKSGTYTVPVFVLDYSGSTYTMENVEMTSGVPTKFRTDDEVMGATEYYRSTDRHYTFVGTFYKSFLPHYSYFLGWDSSINGARFFYHNGNFATIDNEMRWANGTGVIVPTLADDLEGNPLAFKYSVTQASDMAHPAQWSLLETFKDDSFVTSGGTGAKQYVMEFDSPDVKYSDNIDTGIENIEANKESGANISAAQGVYTLDGRKVSDSLQGLPKGIYVVNGKKFVVK